VISAFFAFPAVKFFQSTTVTGSNSPLSPLQVSFEACKRFRKQQCKPRLFRSDLYVLCVLCG